MEVSQKIKMLMLERLKAKERRVTEDEIVGWHH